MRITLILVPYDSGMRGARMGAGPEHLIDRGLGDRLRDAGHDVTVETVELPDGFFPAEVASAFELARGVASSVGQAVAAGRFPFILSGNCSTALGTVAGLGLRDAGIVWLDAHGDFNTPETTGSGFFDGTTLATATGRCWTTAAAGIPGFTAVAESRVVHIGARDFDRAEKNALSESGLTMLAPAEVRSGLGAALRRKKGDITDVYLHIDLDVLDKRAGAVNSYAAHDGLSPADIDSVVTEVAEAFCIRAASITAYDPRYDTDGKVAGIAMAVSLSIARELD